MLFRSFIFFTYSFLFLSLFLCGHLIEQVVGEHWTRTSPAPPPQRTCAVVMPGQHHSWLLPASSSGRPARVRGPHRGSGRSSSGGRGHGRGRISPELSVRPRSAWTARWRRRNFLLRRQWLRGKERRKEAGTHRAGAALAAGRATPRPHRALPCRATPPPCSHSGAPPRSSTPPTPTAAAVQQPGRRSHAPALPFFSSGRVGSATRRSTSPPPERGGLLFLLREHGGLHRSWPPPASSSATSLPLLCA